MLTSGNPHMTTKKTAALLAVGAIPLAFVLYPAGTAVVTGCAPQQRAAAPATPIPDFSSGLYNFPKFEIPSGKKAAGSTGLTVLSIIPEYKDTGTKEYSSGEKAARGGWTKEMAKVFKSFAGSAGEDIEAMMVAKGMTSKGPFVLDEVTFPDKKGADLTVLMQFIFDIQYSEEKVIQGHVNYEGGKAGAVHSGTMSVGMKVYYYLLEPLSEEKMWVKKLDLGSQDFTYEYAPESEQYVAGTTWVSDGCGGGYNRTNYAWRSTGKNIYDTRAHLFSGLLKQTYPQLMNTAWKYFDAEEMINLKAKAKDIRDRWGSSSFRRGAPD